MTHERRDADESMMSLHSVPRRNSQSEPFRDSTEFSLLPTRPRSSGNTGRSSTASELLGLQVRGFCCPLQQRPSSGRTTHRVSTQSRRGGGGSRTLLNGLKGRLDVREEPASRSRSRSWSRPEMTAGGGAPSVCHHRDPISESAETPTTPSDERRTLHALTGATKVSELHLYLPSSLCDDEEQDAETADMRATAEDTQGSELNMTQC
ncbi:uncharacterized protein LOC132973791 [Labrus mixtus]|uniref:uncharacterized protein LOC132973791 n=1 Tax=Labrus mixtus TaxID=508554 RepID=UPI0029C05243|nr:uncharacterized protein LOC132973791 [Labrus mixtus]XP_060893378.1 uncharacterized protein LOC132973791 [Labrus mixtus]